jgi:hypothetical protein
MLSIKKKVVVISYPEILILDPDHLSSLCLQDNKVQFRVLSKMRAVARTKSGCRIADVIVERWAMRQMKNIVIGFLYLKR